MKNYLHVFVAVTLTVLTVPAAARQSFQGVGDLPGGNFTSQAIGVSPDGSVVVGASNSASLQELYRWTCRSGMVGLGSLPGNSIWSLGFSASTNGSVVVGFNMFLTSGSTSTEAFRWTSESGMVGLGVPPGSDSSSEAISVSADGSVVVGVASEDFFSRQAFRWTSEGGMVGLGVLPGDSAWSEAWGVSADGSVVVGINANQFGPSNAFIWDATNGMQNLQSVLVDQLGLDLTGWTLTRAWDISDDGTTIVGDGDNPDGFKIGFIAVISDSVDSDCNGNGIVDCQDITDGTSLDVNVNGLPDECEATIDTGTTALINPTGGSAAPADAPLVEVTNNTGGAGETVTVSISNVDLHPGTAGFSVVGSTASVNTSMADGEFFMTITMPFDLAGFAGADWTLVDLLYFNTTTGLWELAVAANTINSPGYLVPEGDRFVQSDTVDLTLGDLSLELGDYGVFWNTLTLQGFAWANVDHTTDFTAGIAICLADTNFDGSVNVTDLLALLAAWGPNPGHVADFNGDGNVNVTDLLTLLAAWGVCP